MDAELAARFAARGASTTFVARVKHLGVEGPPLEKLKSGARGVKFTEDTGRGTDKPREALPHPESSSMTFVERPSDAQSVDPKRASVSSVKGDLRARAMSKKGINVDDVLMRALAEDVEMDELEAMVRQDGLVDSDGEDEDAPGESSRHVHQVLFSMQKSHARSTHSHILTTFQSSHSPLQQSFGLIRIASPSMLCSWPSRPILSTSWVWRRSRG